MSKFSILSMVCAVTLISGCDHYSNKLASMDSNPTDVSSISPAAGGEMTFKNYLKNEYAQLARYEENQSKDYRAAKYYTQKIEKLEEGQMVSPAGLNDFKVGADDIQEIAVAREELLNALKTYRYPENRPTLAKAQSRYDCWMDQAEETANGKPNETCRAEYKQAMSELVKAAPTGMIFPINFEYGSSTLSERAQLSLEQAIVYYRQNNMQPQQVYLSPSMDMPEAEAQRRISMLRSIMAYNGIPADNIMVSETKEPQFQIMVLPETIVELPAQL